MSFSYQKAICYFIDLAIPVLVANLLYKTPAVLKHQQFKDSGSDKIEPKDLKRQWINLHDDK